MLIFWLTVLFASLGPARPAQYDDLVLPFCLRGIDGRRST